MRRLNFGIILFLFVASVAMAQTKIGYVDTQSLSTELKEAKDIKKKMEAVEKEFTDRKQKMINDFTELQEKYETSKLILTEQKRQEMLVSLNDKQKEIASFDQRNQPVFTQRIQDLMAPYQAKIVAAIEEVRKQKKLDMILDKQVIVAVDESLDITADVKNYLEKPTGTK